MCVAMLTEDSCSEFSIFKDVDLRGSDLSGLSQIPVPQGITQCQDLCLANQAVFENSK